MSNEPIDTVLKERGSRYGPFTSHATIAQAIKSIVKTPDLMKRLSHAVECGGITLEECNAIVETLDMIAHKLARISNGDPTYDDSWRDIEGYAKLVTKMLEKKHDER